MNETKFRCLLFSLLFLVFFLFSLFCSELGKKKSTKVTEEIGVHREIERRDRRGREGEIHPSSQLLATAQRVARVSRSGAYQLTAEVPLLSVSGRAAASRSFFNGYLGGLLTWRYQARSNPACIVPSSNYFTPTARLLSPWYLFRLDDSKLDGWMTIFFSSFCLSNYAHLSQTDDLKWIPRLRRAPSTRFYRNTT